MKNQDSFAFLTLIATIIIAGTFVFFEFKPILRNYQRECLEAVAAVEIILIENEMCQTPSDCRSKELVFFAPWGAVYLSIYSIESDRIAKQIESVLCSLQMNESDVEYYAELYATSRHSKNQFLRKTITLNRGSKCLQ